MQLIDSKVEFIEHDHTYWLEDKRLHGITGVIKKHLFPDMYLGVPDSVLQKAGERGTQIHKDLHTTDMFGTELTDVQRAYKQMMKGRTVIDNEYIVSDGEYFASPIDKVLISGDEVILADVKTTYTLNRKYVAWQLSIYKYLFELQNPGVKVAALACIHISNENEVTWHDIDEVPQKEVKKLLEAERNGEEYQNPMLLTEQNDKVAAMIASIAELEWVAKRAKEDREKMRKQITEIFESKGVERWETDSFVITMRSEYVRTTIDGTTLKKEMPEVWEKFKKETVVKSTIQTKLK